jgi:hypothetical protein
MEVNEETLRKIVLSDEFSVYYDSLSKKIQEKYAYTMQIIKTQKVVSEKFVKKIQNTEFYEVRVSIGTNEYRTVLIATDNENFMEATRVVFLNSFLKKDSKQYNSEVKKARIIIEKEEIV